MAYVVVGYWVTGYVTTDSSSDLATALQSPAPGAVIELFQLQLTAAQHGVDATYYFHAGVNQNNTDIIWAGQAYQPLPIEADGFEWSGQGSLPRPKFRVANIFGSITTLLLTLPDGLDGAKVTRIRTLGRYLDAENFSSLDALLLEDGGYFLTEDGFRIQLEAINSTADPYAEWPREVYYVDRKSAETRDVVEFELASAFDLAGVRAPRRQCVTRCQWKYRSAECGYTGTSYFDAQDQVVGSLSQDVCGKRVDSCKLRFGQTAQLPYGGYPGIGTYFT